jgi:hypothetical protein
VNWYYANAKVSSLYFVLLNSPAVAWETKGNNS